MTPARRRLQTPPDGGLLTEPAFADVPALVGNNRQLLDTDRVQIDGVPLRELRLLTRREIFDTSDSRPLVVTGHQPEPFHVGVWVKNFAARGLADRVGGRSLNLIVDNDAVKSPVLKVPAWFPHEPTKVRPPGVRLTTARGDHIWETLTPGDEAEWQGVPHRIAVVTRGWPFEPVLPQVWPRMTGRTVGERFTAARRSFELACGCDNPELAVSRVCRTRAFRHFACHLFRDADRFRTAYNAAARDYRRRYDLRSETHPVPDLAADELPFWAVTGDRREKATAKTPPDQLRPRALTLTLFARLCVGDFFLHGIGGGKYDEVTDQIIRNYFGLEPPAYQVVSATLLLPLPLFPATAADVMRQKRLVRDLHWNPHRHLADDAAVAHTELRGRQPTDHAGRRQQCRDFRALAGRLRPRVRDQLTRAEAELRRLEAEAKANAVLRRRDYSWLLYPRDVLRTFLQDVQRQASAG